MSYSRWGKDSVWYCFWSAVGPNNQYKFPTNKLKNAQVFEICDYPSMYITYGELKQDFKGVVKRIEEFYSKSYLQEREDDTIKWNAKNPTFQQMTEIRKYMLEFIWDIDQHFKWYTFFLYEWYYPFRNEIRWKFKKFYRILSPNNKTK